jgi:hypothetical protein
MDPIKAITSAAEQLAAAAPATAPEWQHCMQALLEVMFMHGSRPLHKQLLSSMRKLPQGHQAVVAHVVQGLVAREATGVRGMSHLCEVHVTCVWVDVTLFHSGCRRLLTKL